MSPLTCVICAIPENVEPLEHVLEAISGYLRPRTLDGAARKNLVSVIRSNAHLPCSFDAITDAAGRGFGEVIAWAYETADGRLSWSQAQLGTVLLALAKATTAASAVPSTLVTTLSSKCGAVAASLALVEVATRNRLALTKAILDGACGKTLDVYEAFERTNWQRIEGEDDDPADEYSDVLLALAQCCRGYDVDRAFDLSVEESLGDCVRVLVHRVSWNHVAEAFHLLHDYHLGDREDLRMTLARRSTADGYFSESAFHYLLKRGLHDEAEEIARTVAETQIGLALTAIVGHAVREEGDILASRCTGKTSLQAPLIAMIISGEHLDVAETLATKPIPEFGLGRVLESLISSRPGKSVAMERLVAQLRSGFYTFDVLKTAVKHDKAKWMVLQIMGQGVDGPLVDEAQYALKALQQTVEFKLFDAAKTVIQAFMECKSNEYSRASYSIGMLRVAVLHLDELREEADLLVSNCLAHHNTEAFEVAAEAGLRTSTLRLAEACPDYMLGTLYEEALRRGMDEEASVLAQREYAKDWQTAHGAKEKLETVRASKHKMPKTELTLIEAIVSRDESFESPSKAHEFDEEFVQAVRRDDRDAAIGTLCFCGGPMLVIAFDAAVKKGWHLEARILALKCKGADAAAAFKTAVENGLSPIASSLAARCSGEALVDSFELAVEHELQDEARAIASNCDAFNALAVFTEVARRGLAQHYAMVVDICVRWCPQEAFEVATQHRMFEEAKLLGARVIADNIHAEKTKIGTGRVWKGLREKSQRMNARRVRTKYQYKGRRAHLPEKELLKLDAMLEVW